METLLSESPKKTVADPVNTRELGVILVPQIVVRTPAYIEAVLPETPAARLADLDAHARTGLDAPDPIRKPQSAVPKETPS